MRGGPIVRPQSGLRSPERHPLLIRQALPLSLMLCADRVLFELPRLEVRVIHPAPRSLNDIAAELGPPDSHVKPEVRPTSRRSSSGRAPLARHFLCEERQEI